MANLKETEYLADTITHKVEQLMKERIMLRAELERRSSRSLEGEKALAAAFRASIIDGALNAARVDRLEHMLMLRGVR